MKIFKLIEIDLEAERDRIKRPGTYNKRQRKVLLDLVDLFEAGEWKKCLDFVNNKKNFPYNKDSEYPEQEHISWEISSVLHGLAYDYYYTREEILNEAWELLKKNK